MKVNTTPQSVNKKTLLPCLLLTASCLLIPSTGFTTDFEGTLKGVTITDAEGTNTPPVAAFTYTITDNTVSFDSSASNDPDGTITTVQWDFGDGNVETGASVTHTYDSFGLYPITLTVLDNNSGVSLKQETINLSSCTSQSVLLAQTGTGSANSGGIYSATTVYGFKVTGNGGALHSVKLRTGTTPNGSSTTARIYVNTSPSFSGTNTAEVDITTPGTTSTEFSASFNNGPILSTGVEYYVAIADPDINWGTRFNLTLVSDPATKNYYLSTNGLESPLNQQTGLPYSIWAEVNVCD